MKKTTKKVTTTKQKRSKKKMSVLEAKSANTGLIHHFGNLPAWKKRMKEYENKYGSRIAVDLSNALSFVTFLSSQQASFTLSSFVPVKIPVYRVVAPVFDVWSVAGSLGDGGRFNIGSAQTVSELPQIRKFAALYVASDLKCALAEATKPLGVAKAFELTPKKEFLLWDLDKIIHELNYPGLDELIKSIPNEAAWVLQKAPLASQIIAWYLKQKGGDGIVFPSTKEPSSKNFALWFTSDKDSEKSFDIAEVAIPD